MSCIIISYGISNPIRPQFSWAKDRDDEIFFKSYVLERFIDMSKYREDSQWANQQKTLLFQRIGITLVEGGLGEYIIAYLPSVQYLEGTTKFQVGLEPAPDVLKRMKVLTQEFKFDDPFTTSWHAVSET